MKNVSQDQNNCKPKRTVSNGLKIFHQNTDRIKNKIDRLNHLLHAISPDLLIVTEHGLNDTDMANTRLSNYSLVSAFCRQNILKGGVAIYKRNSLENEIESLNIENLSSPLICEASAVSIRLNKRENIVVLGIYRPPKNDKQSYTAALLTLSSILDKSTSQGNIIIIMGDFNVDSLVPSPEGRQLVELLMTYNVHRLDLPPTRITNTSSTSIDIFCISDDHKDEVNIQVSNTGISDHTGQLCELNFMMKKTPTTTITRRHINTNSLDNLKIFFTLQSWEDVLKCTNLDRAYENFLTIITLALNTTCPLRKLRQRPSSSVKHVFDAEASYLKKQFLSALNAYTLHGRNEDKQRSSELKKLYDLKLRSLRREASAAYIADSNNKSKAVWRVINGERKGKAEPEDIKLLEVGNVSLTDPIDIANQFNSYFTTIAEETLRANSGEGGNCFEFRNWEVESPTSSWILASERELLEIISAMRGKTSAGLDDFSSVMLKHCCNELLTPLLHVCNLSLAQGLFPRAMKTSKVIPLHKKGSKHKPENYRPISLVSTFSKLIEKIILARISVHLQSNNLSLSGQHGFTPKKSTSTALVDLVEYMVDRMEEGESVVGFFLDLSKAFDCLDHAMVLTKLEHLGFRDTALSWFKSYLCERDQLVELKQSTKGVSVLHKSNKQPVKRGVPQGSVLGPVLFVLFTSDFPAYMEPYSNTIMYADDTVLLISGRNRDALEAQSFVALNVSVDYCAANDLVFNALKTKKMNLGIMKDELLGFPNLDSVNTVEHLGVVVDNKLSWVDHVDKLCSKLSSALFAIKRVKHVGTADAARTAYNSLFECYLRYGIVLWGATAAGNLERVLITQKKAIRILADLAWRDSCRGAFKELGILTVTNVYLLEVICMASSRQLQRHMDTHTYQTRNARDFALPIHHSHRFQSKPSYAGAKLFNVLPDPIKRADTATLKKKLQDWLLERPFYTINEFLDWPNFTL